MEAPASLPVRLYSITCNFQEQKLLGFTWLGKREVYPCTIEASQLLMLKASWL